MLGLEISAPGSGDLGLKAQGFVCGGFPKLGVLFWGGPYNKKNSVLGPTLGSPYLGKLPLG